MINNFKTKFLSKLSYFLLAFIFISCLSGCGFHARGITTLAPPLKRLYLKTPSPYNELTNNLRQYLKMSGVYLTETPQEATTILDVLSEKTVQQLLGVSGSQQTRQYNLLLSVTFNVTKPNGSILLPAQTLSQSRTLPINSGEVLAASNQAAALYQQMRRAIVFDIMNRLSSEYVTAQLLSQYNP